ncbi:unnamed protein product [Lymnaea stagnalis]|uniref:non-specific serine/threonine protein kinase n=1 Tax=Lymnaea stagnalis TaxID=6523 RepID=A0AAV2H0D3_LYMST
MAIRNSYRERWIWSHLPRYDPSTVRGHEVGGARAQRCIFLYSRVNNTFFYFFFFILLVFSASKDSSKPVDLKTAEFVIKIEAKSNGPLFCEMQFYQRAAKPAVIQSFIAEQKLRYLGVPPFIATGSFENFSREYRFLVMNRYGTDLQKILVQCGGRFAPNATFAVGLRMLDALYFLHENEYVHADVKAANILLGYGGGQDIQSEVYLVDFGLAYRYKVEGKHKEYKEDPRKAHDGTIEFTSVDAHKGVSPSRRGDLEILGYCMLQWLGGTLPWEDNLRSPSYVANSKEKYMKDIPSLINATIPSTDILSIDCMRKYFIAVTELGYETKPNYTRFKDILKYCLTKGGQADEWIIDFSDRATKRGTKRKSAESGSPKAKKIKSPSVPKGPKTPLAKKSPAASKRAPKAKLISSTNQVKVKSPRAKKASKVIAKTKRISSTPPSNKSSKKTQDKSLPAGHSPAKQKNFPMPPPTKSLKANTDAADSNSKGKVTRRRRPNVSLATTAVQTSPGLKRSQR